MTLLIAALSLSIGLLLGLLGGGGSVLAVPMLVYLAHLEPKAAIATSFLVVGTTSAVAVLPQIWRGKVCWAAGTTFGMAAIVGAYLGARLAAWIPEKILMLLFAAMMLVTVFAMLRKKTAIDNDSHSACPHGLALISVVLIGIVVSTFTGMVGAGGGFLIVPALTLFGGLSMRLAIGTSLLVVTLSSFSGLVGYLSHVQIDMTFAATVTGLAVLGTLIGSGLTAYISAAVLRRVFALLVFSVAWYLLWRETDLRMIIDLIKPILNSLLT